MLTTTTLVVAAALTAGVLALALWHNFQPERSVTQILAELETKPVK